MPYKDREKLLSFKRAYNKQWREKNPEAYKKIAQRSKKKCSGNNVKYLNKRYYEATSILNEYKGNNGCVICGEKDYRCLDFHHVNREDKLFTISRKTGRYDMKIIWEEIKKCIVLCSNCHRKVSYK